MQPDQDLTPYTTLTHRTVLRLNGVTWVLLGLCPLLAVLLRQLQGDYDIAVVILLLLMLPIAAVGALANLLLALWYGILGRGRQAGPYLLGFLLLLLCLVGQMNFLKAHPLIGKFGG
jgi:hypothetical protein